MAVTPTTISNATQNDVTVISPIVNPANDVVVAVTMPDGSNTKADISVIQDAAGFWQVAVHNASGGLANDSLDAEIVLPQADGYAKQRLAMKFGMEGANLTAQIIDGWQSDRDVSIPGDILVNTEDFPRAA